MSIRRRPRRASAAPPRPAAAPRRGSQLGAREREAAPRPSAAPRGRAPRPVAMIRVRPPPLPFPRPSTAALVSKLPPAPLLPLRKGRRVGPHQPNDRSGRRPSAPAGSLSASASPGRSESPLDRVPDAHSSSIPSVFGVVRGVSASASERRPARGKVFRAGTGGAPSRRSRSWYQIRSALATSATCSGRRGGGSRRSPRIRGVDRSAGFARSSPPGRPGSRPGRSGRARAS